MAQVLRTGAQVLNWDHRQAQGLVCAYPLSEVGGKVAHDAGPNAFHGTLASVMTDADWVATTRGMALEYDGTGDVVTLPTLGQEIGSGEFTMTTWIKHADPNLAVVMGENTTTVTWLAVNGSTSTRFRITSGTVRDLAATNDGAWHLVVCGRRSGVEFGSIDGDPATLFGASTANFTGTAFGLGAFGAGTFPYEGQQRDARIYSRGFTDEDIFDLYANPNALYVNDDLSWLYAAFVGGTAPAAFPFHRYYGGLI